ncbi:MAG: nitrous oxide reductase family maturation protein NosD [Acidobacteria bacterium]|nr:nitrous oxide reductase family maturation protein NosD [Acidobacteriota bacterium]
MALVLAGLLLQAAVSGAVDQARPLEAAGATPAKQVSPLQVLVDGASPGDRIVVPAGTYEGDLVIDRALTLVGEGRPLLLGSGVGSVVSVRAADVSIEGFDIDGRGGGDLGQDASGIHIAAPRARVTDCRVRQTLFGIYLREADGAVVERSRVNGLPGRPPGEIGSGIHVWNTQGFRLEDNTIIDVRDGLYIQSSSDGVVRGNTARDLRYGIHYMFSDDNLFEDNTFANGDAGAAIMYSRRLTFRRNRFLHNRGFASAGLLFKECDDVVAEDNLIADNARGIFIEGSYRNRFVGNIIAMSDMALVIYDSAGSNVFEGNAFVGNLTPLSLVGRRTDTRFAGNYWSDHDEPDLDGDGYADRPYRLSNVFDHLRGNVIAADLFAQGLAARALGVAERAFPVLDAIPVVDDRPLVRMPPLPNVPRLTAAEGPAATGAGMMWPVTLALGGAWVLLAGGRSPVARRLGAGGVS